MSIYIRDLVPDDAFVVRELRLRALREHPESFASSFDEESVHPVEETARRLAAEPEPVRLGAFLSGVLVGIAVLNRSSKAKLRHRATITSMYVSPEARGQQIGRALLERALQLAEEWGVSDVAVAVTLGNQQARNLYASAGFLPYGIEPRSMLVEGRFYDVELMNLQVPRSFTLGTHDTKTV